MNVTFNTNKPTRQIAFGTVIKLDLDVKNLLNTAVEHKQIAEIVDIAANDGLEYQLTVKKYGDTLKGHIFGLSKSAIDEVFLPASFDSFGKDMSHRGLDKIPERIKNIYDNAVRTINSQSIIIKRMFNIKD